MAQNKQHNKVVLATRFSALGDVAMTIPALYDACTSNPDATIVMLTRRSMTGLFVNRPDNLIIEGVNLDDYKGIAGMWRLMGEMVTRHGITAYADLHDVLRTKLLRIAARLKGIPTAHIDKGRSEKKRLTRRAHKVMLPLTNSVDRYRATLAAVGLAAEPRFVGLFDGRPSDPTAYAAITPPRQPGETWIGIAPFAKHEGKIYPPSLMEQVVRELSGRTGTTVFLFGGGPYEQKILGEWARKYPSTISLAGKRYGFDVEMALFRDLDAMITMDSANMHMAALAGSPVIAVWGATHPYCGFSGWHIPDDRNIQLPIPCRPCSVFGNKPCLTGDYRCMTSIKPNYITDKVDEIIAKRHNS
ncbi:MAG: glycosyltransferase family 9 protein [Muribaculaceae bacterium]|nr:glycosyltransferase family 9 protein [Muribaculaceae bacterium]